MLIYPSIQFAWSLTHWGRVTHKCVSKLTIIGSDNGLSPDRRQAIIWTNTGILLIRSIGTNFSEILSEIHAFSLNKMHFKMSSDKWRPFCLGLNVLIQDISVGMWSKIFRRFSCSLPVSTRQKSLWNYINIWNYSKSFYKTHICFICRVFVIGFDGAETIVANVQTKSRKKMSRTKG